MNTNATVSAANGHPSQYAEISHSLITPSPTNPRKRFDQAELDELAQSIKEKGIIEPVLVRSSARGAGKNKAIAYELIAGERRLRAAEIAGLETVPAIIREMSDDEVLDVQIHENLHRADVHPIDEAFGYQHLLKVVQGLTIEELARRVGKSARYVAQRLSLTTLIESAVKDFGDGLITLGHAVQISRLSPEVQPRALEACYGQTHVRWDAKIGEYIYKPDKADLQTVADLTDWINGNISLDLTRAPWSLEDAELVPTQGACATCPANTATNQLLFGDAAQTATCTNPEGYKRKMEAWIARQIEECKKQGHEPALLTNIYSSIDQSDIRRHNLPSGALATQSFTVIKKKADRCEFARPGVYVHGHERGLTEWVCTNPKCKDHKARIDYSVARNKSEQGATPESEKAKLYKRKQELFDARVAEPVRRRTLRAILERIEPAQPEDSSGWLLDIGYFRRIAWEHFRRIATDTQTVMYEVLGWDSVIEMSGGYGSKRQAAVKDFIDIMNNRNLARFMVLCSIVHYGENINIYGAVDQSEIVTLAEAHNVPYKLFDARERVNQCPGKKYVTRLNIHLMETLLGRNPERPLLYPHVEDDKERGKLMNLGEEVKEKVTPFPFLDGPEGVVRINALVRVIGGEHRGKEGVLVDASNASGGVACKVACENKHLDVLARDLLYVEYPPVVAESKPESKAVKQKTATKKKRATAATA